MKQIDYQTGGVFVVASLSPARFAKLRSLYPEGFPPPGQKELWE